MNANGNTPGPLFVDAWNRVQELPTQVQSGLKAHPFATVTVIAGISFVCGMVMGSRVARAVIAAVAPAVVGRLLAGPLGDRLDRTIGDALRSSSAKSPTAS